MDNSFRFHNQEIGEMGSPLPHDEKSQEMQSLRLEVLQQVHKNVESRIQENPVPTEQELVLGTFVEDLEPQVKDAVLKMNEKGYTTSSSGFWRTIYQCIDGPFVLDMDSIDQLEFMGVQVDIDQGYTHIKFEPETPDLQKMTQTWNKIAEVIKPRHKPALLSDTWGSMLFWEKYDIHNQMPRIKREREIANGLDYRR